MENDPTGRNPHEAGAKLDAGKLRAGLVLGDFSRALTEVCAVGTFGANKYTPHGWLSVPDAQQRYTDAMMRHWLKDQAGETVDPDSGLSHKAHFAWNALVILELTFDARIPEPTMEVPEYMMNARPSLADKDAFRHIQGFPTQEEYERDMARFLFPHLFPGET